MANRTIPFSLVAEKAQVSVDDVEFLAMKTFSRGLVWGSIDQVDQVINIEWIKPRALSLDQVQSKKLWYTIVRYDYLIRASFR